MKLVLPVFLVLIAVATANVEDDEVDSCYHCFSTTSWTDCYDQEYREDCRDYCRSRGIACDRCYKYYDITNNLYVKGCAQKVNCDNAWRDLCMSPECEIHCCDGNNCNGSARLSVSLGIVFAMVLSTIVSYLA